MNVLLGLEGSDESMKTLEQTLERTREAGDELSIAVLENPGAKRTQEEVYRAVEDLLAEGDVDAEIRMLEGDPGSTLVEAAAREDVDQLVIGGGTTSPMGKIRLGSITEFVLLNATTTVTLVR